MSSKPTGSTAGEDRCCRRTEHTLTGEELSTDVRTLAAVGNDTRYETLRLVSSGDGGVCGCEIEPSLDVSQGAVSQALSKLHAADLVTRRTEGRWRYYETTERAERLLDVLDETRGSTDE